ncbi:uncharacterized protein LOC114943920 [Nylanderia fulva]|uniref:uncharacterized protein LOC114943920 n=1 Tax=Nylanderia fulva TaxID=613905 RepID=UPI0010FB69D6|nr:uncharacterized protein LOC114943920 [Nylanderia fulva]
METASTSSNNDTNIEQIDEDTEKKKLRQEIKSLECLIEQCEQKLNTICFGDVEEHLTESPNLKILPHSRRIPNVEVDLQNELYNFAGFHCAKFRRDEIVFNFKPTSKYQKNDTYAIQIFIKNGKGELGKWVMPMSFDVNDMLSKIPIDKTKNIGPFLKSCQHNIDCYVARQDQFLSLKEYTLHMKHCSLHSNMAYTQISLELYGIHDKENDKYMNLVIYLLYHSHIARPYKINIDTMEEKKLNDDLRRQLKICLKEFKILDLQTAFEKILTEDSAFTWLRTDDSDSPLELNDTSDSTEDFVVDLQLNRNKLLRKRKRKHERQKRNERKKRKNTSKNIELSNNNEEDSYTQVTSTKSSRQILKENETEKLPSTSKQKVFRNLPEETTPLYKPKIRLKQTKLNFHTNQPTNNSKDANFDSKLHDELVKKKLKITPLGTSTPLPDTIRNKKVSSSSSSEMGNITNIEILKPTIDKLKKSKGSRLTNKIVKKKAPKLSQGTIEAIRSSSRTVKTDQRRMRNMKNKNMRK